MSDAPLSRHSAMAHDWYRPDPCAPVRVCRRCGETRADQWQATGPCRPASRLRDTGGICDGCSKTVDELRVFNSPGVACGICFCQECAGEHWDQLEEIERAAA